MVDTYVVVLGLTLVGLVLAAAAVPPLRDIASLSPTPRLRRAWAVLTWAIVLCVTLRGTAAVFRLRSDVGVSDVLDAFVNLIGPGFVLSVAWL